MTPFKQNYLTSKTIFQTAGAWWLRITVGAAEAAARLRLAIDDHTCAQEMLCKWRSNNSFQGNEPNPFDYALLTIE
jgi:hypothetical protein